MMVCKPGGQNFADVCHTQMGIKSQAMISIWICPLLGQCFTQDKGEEDFQGGYGYRQRVWSNLWQTLLPRDTRACYRTEPFCLSSWSRVDFFLNQINSQGVFYLPDWFILFCSDLGQEFLHPAGCGRRWLTGRDDVSGCYSVSGDFSVWLPPFCSSSVSLGYWHGCLFLRRTSEMSIQILN